MVQELFVAGSLGTTLLLFCRVSVYLYHMSTVVPFSLWARKLFLFLLTDIAVDSVFVWDVTGCVSGLYRVTLPPFLLFNRDLLGCVR